MLQELLELPYQHYLSDLRLNLKVPQESPYHRHQSYLNLMVLLVPQELLVRLMVLVFEG